MHLTRENFDASLPKIASLLKTASFVAFDLEFSGLHASSAGRQTFVDTVRSRFSAALKSTGSFFPLQLGLAVFSEHQQGLWNVTPISIHVIPTEDEPRDFAIQPSSIAYLAANGFNFQHSFGNGVGWLTLEKESSLMQQLEKGSESSVREDIVVTEERDKQFVTSILSLLKSPASGSALLETPEFFQQNDIEPSLRQDCLVLKPMNRFLKRLVYETVAREDALVVVVPIGDRLALKRLRSANEVEAFRAEQLQKQKDAIRSRAGMSFLEKKKKMNHMTQTGVRQVLDLIAVMGVPVIGHNSLLDLFYLLNMSHKLSDDLDGFKSLIRTRFPGGLADTKHLAQIHFNREAFPGTGLQELSAALDFPPITLSGEVKSQFHDASYDALQTGRVFLGLAKKRNVDWRSLLSSGCFQVPLNASDAFVNCNGPDKDPDFSAVLIASNFPSGWKQSQISAQLSAPVKKWAWMSDTQVAMMFAGASTANSVLEKHTGVFRLERFLDHTGDFAPPTSGGGLKRGRSESSAAAAQGEVETRKRGLFGWGTWLF